MSTYKEKCLTLFLPYSHPLRGPRTCCLQPVAGLRSSASLTSAFTSKFGTCEGGVSTAERGAAAPSAPRHPAFHSAGSLPLRCPSSLPSAAPPSPVWQRMCNTPPLPEGQVEAAGLSWATVLETYFLLHITGTEYSHRGISLFFSLRKNSFNRKTFFLLTPTHDRVGYLFSY